MSGGGASVSQAAHGSVELAAFGAGLVHFLRDRTSCAVSCVVIRLPEGYLAHLINEASNGLAFGAFHARYAEEDPRN